MRTTTIPEIRCVVQGADMLGEVPLWCDRTSKLWWVDVRRPAVQSYDPATGQHTAQRMPADLLPGSIAFRDKGGFVMGTNAGIYFFDPESGLPAKFLVNPEADKPINRLNDGKCDRRGRFWVGSMSDARDGSKAGTLYRLDADHSVHAMLADFALPNSLCWSPDNRTMYFADTHHQVIWSFDYDIDDGVMTNRRVFKDWTGQVGRPDGSTVDAEGYLWNCMVLSGQVVRYAPDGSIDRIIQMPVTNPTCPAFGGDKLDTLYITSHSQRLAPEVLAKEPLAGGLFAIDVGVKGLPEARYLG